MMERRGEKNVGKKMREGNTDYGRKQGWRITG